MTDDKTTLPLVVDLDGTLILSDLLVESFFTLAARAPMAALRSLWRLRKNRAAFKLAIAHQTGLEVTHLPWNKLLLEWLRQEHQRGRPIYLASASALHYVQQIADHLGIFTGVFGSTATSNLRGTAKAEALCAAFGENAFDYVGNDPIDLKVWEKSAGVIVTNASPAWAAKVQQRFAHARYIGGTHAGNLDSLAALRPHQWLKNLLIFVPALVGHQFDIASLTACLLAFISFSLCASGGYLINDLLDLPHDRAHPTKRNRPLASGRLDPRRALSLLGLTLATAFLLALTLPPLFMAALLLYLLLTIAYSTCLKRRMTLDVIVLSLLYGLRLVAGGAALDIPLSPWLLSFSSFFFLSLALVKRCAELVMQQALGNGDPAGRGYRLGDLPILQSMAAASGYVAVLTCGLYINSNKVTELYTTPSLLWAVPIILLFWISRLLLLTHRGDMPDDPVLFAAHDRTSLICGANIVAVLLLSI